MESEKDSKERLSGVHHPLEAKHAMEDPKWSCLDPAPVLGRVVPLLAAVISDELLERLFAVNCLTKVQYETLRRSNQSLGKSDDVAENLISLLKSKPIESFDSFCDALGTVEEELVLLECISRAAVQQFNVLRYSTELHGFMYQLVINDVHWSLINKWRSNECTEVIRTILEGTFPQGTFEITNQFVPSIDLKPVIYFGGGIDPRSEPLLGISLTGDLEMEKAREELSTTLSQVLQIPTENIQIVTSRQIFSDNLEDTEDRFQQIYDNALKRGSVAVDRCRVTVVGQDGAGKSCLVDSLLDRPFEEGKASTEGAALEMTHATAIGWKSIERRNHLDPLVAKSLLRH